MSVVQPAKFDWYQATIYVSDPFESGLADLLTATWELSDFAQAKAMHGYTYGAEVRRGDNVLCRVWWGGNPGVHVTSSSVEAPTLAAALKRFGKMTAVSRVDSCVDWDEEGLFDSLAAHMIEFAQARRISINQQGDWARGEGRTLYLGSTQSAIQICLYEKGFEQGGVMAGVSLDWVRMEVRLRPTKEARLDVSQWGPDDVFTAGWVGDLLGVLGWEKLKHQAVGTVWRPSDKDRARIAFLAQYGKTIEAWANEAGGWDSFGVVLGEALSEHRQRIADRSGSQAAETA